MIEPLTFDNETTSLNHFTEPLFSSIDEITFIGLSISPSKDTLTVWLAIIEITAVTSAVSESHLALAHLFTFMKIPFENITILHIKLAMTLRNTVYEISLQSLAISEDHLALALLLALNESAYVLKYSVALLLALSVRVPLFPLAFVCESTGFLGVAFTMAHALHEVTNIVIA